MWSYALAFVTFAVVFGLMDFLWLSTTFRSVYQSAIGPLLAQKVRIAPATLFYFVYVFGVTVFVLAPSVDSGSWGHAAIRGAAFGLAAYATYDLTNQATLSAWPTRLTLVDLSWGILATAVAASITTLAVPQAAKVLGHN